MFDLNTQLIIAARLLFSFLLGGLIGYERSYQQKPAGSRTHSLVALSSSLFMIISIFGFEGADPARIAAQVVTGMGFIGAGAIWKEGSWVRGLTTATTLWVSSALGLAAGAGLYIPAIVTTALVYAGLEFNTFKRILTGRDEWADRQQMIERLDLGALKAGLETIFTCPAKLSTFNASDPYVLSFELERSWQGNFTLTMTVKGKTLTLVLIYIPEGLRGQGYAMRVIKLVINWAKKNRFQQINLTSTQEVEAMWLKLGFTAVGEATFLMKLDDAQPVHHPVANHSTPV